MRNFDHNRYFGWLSLVPTPVVVGAATLGPLGGLKAPGTWGSAAGVLLYGLLLWPVGWFWMAVILGGLGWLAIGICGEAELRLGMRDPGKIVLDEAVAMPWCFWALDSLIAPWQEQGYGWVVLLVGFLVFRAFDIVKPLGISRLQALPSGWGVVVDDLAAAAATWMTLWLWLTLTIG